MNAVTTITRAERTAANIATRIARNAASKEAAEIARAARNGGVAKPAAKPVAAKPVASAAYTAPAVGNIITGPLVQLLCANSNQFASDMELFLTGAQSLSKEYEIGGKKVTFDAVVDVIGNKTTDNLREYDISVEMDERQELILNATYENGITNECASCTSKEEGNIDIFTNKAKVLQNKPMGDLLAADGIFAKLASETLQSVNSERGRTRPGIEKCDIEWFYNNPNA